LQGSHPGYGYSSSGGASAHGPKVIISGKASPGRSAYTVEQMASDVQALTRGLGFERFYLLRVYLNRFLEAVGIEPAF